MAEEKTNKSKIAEREEEILKFWKENKIFEKSLEKPSPEGEFVFYDGPPFATGLPHYGSLLSSVIKDVVPRYKTMRGYSVRRRWGWDTHGLPIESLVEKKLGLKTKKDIENIGIAIFNKEARSMVLQYASDWEKYIERIGRWVEFKNSYKTMDNSYIESVWWALSEMHQKGLLYEGRKVLMYCPHCETPLAKAEIAMDNSYKDVTEEAVTIKFKVKKPEILGIRGDLYLMAWTTTPWTLPGNVALAVGENIEYLVLRKNDQEAIVVSKHTYMWRGEDFKGYLVQMGFSGEENGKLTGKNLAGLDYEPIFEVPKIKEVDKKNTAYKVYVADFVNTEDGTGIVHTAVMYGEDDYRLGLQIGLPEVQLLDASGKYNKDAPEFLQGKYIKNAENEIKNDLEKRGILFEKKNYTHSYPHCYRCGTPLIYNALPSWFINIQKIKDKLLKLNEKIGWFPEHLKYGRFQNIIENAPDWNISRNRYWASPLPIWKNKKTGEIKVIGSIDGLKKSAKRSGNKYFVMRHGKAEQNVGDFVNSDVKNIFHLNEEGREQVRMAAEDLKKEKVDLIITSPFDRCKETAEIVRIACGLSEESVVVDDRLWEEKAGSAYEGKTWEEFRKNFSTPFERYQKRVEGAETFNDVKKRVGELLYSIEKKHKNKKILFVSHQLTINAMFSVATGTDLKQAVELKQQGKFLFDTAEFGELPFMPLPHNENYELDLHKPYVDEVELVDEDGTELKRIPEVVDCWVESSSMPFAEWHYPVENEKEFKSRFPGDFIAEYIAQTRTWFYYMHAISIALFGGISFKNVVTTGTILAADGSKMSKSLGNYTNPLINIDLFSADSLRFYLMGSVVMQAEDLNFRDEELREAHNRVINMIWNSYKFYEMYAGNKHDINLAPNGDNILDKWIISKLNQTEKAATDLLESYNIPPVCRLIKNFAEDFSTWFLRRSRDRFKGDNAEDTRRAKETTSFVLMQFSKIVAPITPFLAEHIYQGLKSEDDPESVHLCDWPEAGKIDSEILEKMQETRKVVSLALEKRMAAGIKVRQPLNELRIKNNELRGKEEYLNLIKDEVNVKNISFDEKLETEVELDMEITEELRKEGSMREIIRAVQELRKNKGLMPADAIELSVETDEKGKEFLNSVAEDVKKPTNVSKIIYERNDGGELKIDTTTFKLVISRDVS